MPMAKFKVNTLIIEDNLMQFLLLQEFKLLDVKIVWSRFIPVDQSDLFLVSAGMSLFGSMDTSCLASSLFRQPAYLLAI